ncbi:MAG: hypothetical protein LBL83_14160 [Clostridiales bacterium]|jgi:hypothetical protein|nr:hypothetical protein [Clostridiales bacterium]
MTQLIINGVEYPYASKDKYQCYRTYKAENLRMISGRLVTELSYAVVVIEYSYDYFAPELMRRCLADLRPGNDLSVAYLPPDSDELTTGVFKCVKPPAPTFAFGRHDGIARWHNIAFALEGVAGID